jgi:hypothetical protein
MMLHWSSYLYKYPSWIDILAYCTDRFTDVAPTGPSNRPDQYHKASRIHHHLQLGSISRAARCLDEFPILDFSEEVLTTLQALHPSESPPQIT